MRFRISSRRPLKTEFSPVPTMLGCASSTRSRSVDPLRTNPMMKTGTRLGLPIPSGQNPALKICLVCSTLRASTPFDQVGKMDILYSNALVRC